METQIPRQWNRGLQKENKNSAHIMPQFDQLWTICVPVILRPPSILPAMRYMPATASTHASSDVVLD